MYKTFLILFLFFYVNAGVGQTTGSPLYASFLKDTSLSQAPDSLFFYNWNSDANSWENGWKEEFSYANSGLKTAQSNYIWSADHWEPTHQTNYSYVDDKLSQSEYSEWDDYEFDWFPRNRYSYVYDSQGRLTQWLDTKWNPTLASWLNDSAISYNYNESGLLASSYVSIWSATFQDWENYSETLFNYTNGQKIRQVHSLWDFDYLIWDAHRINYFEYDSNQMMSSQKQTVINSFHTQWLNDWKTDYKWNSNNHVQEETNWNWFEDDSSWSESTKTIFYYDIRNNLTNKIEQYFDAYYLDWINQFQTINRYSTSNKLIESTLYSWNYSQWNPVFRYNYYYPDYTDMPEDLAQQIQVYPNPANNKLSIHFFGSFRGAIEIDLYDISGKKVYNSQIQYPDSDIEMELPDLPDGSYVLLLINEKTATKKLVILH
ncbi:MAG: hypothetical protein A2W95_00405 [Bacteroidetes bacterium GWA2_40_14]|nr:MAG: hypothetical protein A2W95_00405 [Bacteroidetes bacterium GWA2_40_14]